MRSDPMKAPTNLWLGGAVAALVAVGSIAVYAAGAQGRTIRRGQQAYVDQNCPGTTDFPACERLVAKQAAEVRRKREADLAAATEARTANTAAIQAVLDADWVKYDEGSAKTKADLLAALAASIQRIESNGETLPIDAGRLLERSRAHFRVRMAPMVSPETRAIGERYATLVPHPDSGVCSLWASMWLMDPETAASLASLGFETIKCGERDWKIPRPADARTATTSAPAGSSGTCTDCDRTRIACLRGVQRGDPADGSEAYADPVGASRTECALAYMACTQEILEKVGTQCPRP
jgi:hypothetical protein